MELKNVIQKKRLIDISIFPNQITTYTGICLKANKNIWILVNYDHSKKVFNGFSIFENNIIETFSIWKRKAVILRNNNLIDFVLGVLLNPSINRIYRIKIIKIKISNFGLIELFHFI